MSAFILSNKHINAMLQAVGHRYGSWPSYYWNGEHRRFDDLTAIGQILVNENFRSVNYRYHSNDEPHKVVQTCLNDNLEPVEIIKACNCYNYQTCETPDWEETEAFAIYDVLRERAIGALPGYREASWSID